MIDDSAQRVELLLRRAGRGSGRTFAVLIFSVALLTVLAVVAAALTDAHDHVAGVGSRPWVASAFEVGRPSVERVAAAEDVLRLQTVAVREQDRSGYLASVDPQARSSLRSAALTYDNLRRMGVREVRFGTPVVDPSGLTPARRAALGPSAWAARIDMTFRLPTGDTDPWRTTLRLVFVDREGTTYVANDSEGGVASPLPLWLTDRVNVVHGRHSLVVGTGDDGELRGFADTADRAVSKVSAVWGSGWEQYVVVLLPSNQAQMERLIGGGAHTQATVAAVTTSVGRTRPERASHIVANPRTFDQLGSLGRLVVLTHEATHVAAHATVSGMPVWLLEGFADFVAFHGSGLSSSVVAWEFLRDVRRRGPPRALPSGAQFDPRAKALDEAYESAWMACRYIAHRWGQLTLLRLYVEMDHAATEGDQYRVYQRVLGVSAERFVQGWRYYVEESSDDD